MAATAAQPQEPQKEEESLEKVLYVSMNQDNSLFALGTTYGFHVFNTDPLQRRFHRDWGSGVGIIELYGKSNIVLLVGSATASRFSPQKLALWDDAANRVIVDVDFYANIVAVRVRRDRIIVALPHSIDILNFTDLTVLAHYSAASSPYSLAVSQTSELPVVVFSRSQTVTGTKGGILVVHQDKNKPAAAAPAGSAPTDEFGEDLLGASASADCVKEIVAHNGPLACLTVSSDGKLAATASDKGTLIRIWNTDTGEKVKEVRRGMDNVNIFAMCFNDDNSLLAAASSSGTLHIFDLVGQQNRTSMFGLFGGYFSSEWSCVSVTVGNQPCTMAFSHDNQSVTIVSLDGTLRRIDFQLGAAPKAELNKRIGVCKLL